jgi:hypothetical protein
MEVGVPLALPTLEESRARCLAAVAALPAPLREIPIDGAAALPAPYPVTFSARLEEETVKALSA